MEASAASAISATHTHRGGWVAPREGVSIALGAACAGSDVSGTAAAAEYRIQVAAHFGAYDLGENPSHLGLHLGTDLLLEVGTATAVVRRHRSTGSAVLATPRVVGHRSDTEAL